MYTYLHGLGVEHKHSTRLLIWEGFSFQNSSYSAVSKTNISQYIREHVIFKIHPKLREIRGVYPEWSLLVIIIDVDQVLPSNS